MAPVLEAAKFLIGAVILLLAAFDVDPQPGIVILALLLMGVLSYDQIHDWLGRRNGHSTPKDSNGTQ